MAVLRLLQLKQEPVPLTTIQTELPEAPSERTLRRWLSELIERGDVERIGQKKATRYRATQPMEAGAGPFSRRSLELIDLVRRPIYERAPVTYNRDWFDSYIPNETFYIPEVLRAQLHAAGQRSSQHDPAGTYARQIYNRLLIDLSYNSSRLEGNTYSRLETERLLLEGAGVDDKLDEEKVMILNHKEGIRYLVEQAFQLDVTDQSVYTIHYLLSDGLLEASEGGRVREHGVRIGGSTYIPYEDTPRLRDQLGRICASAEQIHDPYEQSFFLLVHLTYLQAFADVNKRTARLCCNIPLVKHNMVPLSFNDITREDYTSAVISIYELWEVGPLVDLYAFSYLRTCAAYDATVESMGFDEVRVRYRMQRRRLIRHIVVDLLVGQAMSDYIKDQAQEMVPAKHRSAFIEDVVEDLDQLGPERIAGLGFTLADLEIWQSKS